MQLVSAVSQNSAPGLSCLQVRAESSHRIWQRESFDRSFRRHPGAPLLLGLLHPHPRRGAELARVGIAAAQAAFADGKQLVSLRSHCIADASQAFRHFASPLAWAAAPRPQRTVSNSTADHY